jgi:hypothetical protein
VPSEVEIAWLAGLLEGEGSFGAYASRGRRPQLVAKLKMTDADVVVKAQKLMGAPSVRRECDTRKEQNSDCYVARVYGAKAETLMRLILPHMGTRRSQKITELLNMEGLSHR